MKLQAISILIAVMIGTPIGLLSAQEQSADTVFLNARIYTANDEAPWAEVIAIKGDRIIYVGDHAGLGVTTSTDAQTYDLGGRLIVPGLIDAHTHPGWIAMTTQHLQLPEASTKEELYAAVEKMVRENPERDILIAMAWENELFDVSGPHKDILDAMEPNRPVLIWDAWMHALWVNSKALEVAGIDETVIDPAPGFSFYQRDESGALTGYITEGAASYFWGFFETITPEMESTFLEFLGYLKGQGVTSIFDAGNFATDEALYKLVSGLDERGELPLRYYGSYSLYLPNQYDDAVATLKKMQRQYSGQNFKLDTLKVFMDGVVETRTADMTEDYRDTPGNRGQSLITREQLHALILDLENEGLHLHVHTVGSQAVKTVLDAVEDTHKTLGQAPKIRITVSHLELVNYEELVRFKELGVIANYTPAWHGGNEGYYEAGLGEDTKRMYLAQRLFDDGVPVTFSSDAYFLSQWESGEASPFTGIQIGHNRQYIEGGSAAHIAEPLSDRLSIENMIDGYTKHVAYQQGVEGEFGSLEVGKKADFVILNQNLFEVDRYEIHKVQPDAVILDGELVHGALSTE